MANGYAMSAVLGTEAVMQAAQTTFISSTNWTDRVGPTAALTTLRKYRRLSAEKKLIASGNGVKQIWHDAADEHGLKIKVSGLPTLAACSFEGEHARAMNTRYTVEMLQRGILGFRRFKPSWAHEMGDLDRYRQAVDEVFAQLAADPACAALDTPVHHAGFQRLTKE